MNRIDTVFTRPGHKALIAYVTVGYPSIEATPEIVKTLAESGCDIVELGIPFSDPLADGTTIQEASFRALQSGVTPETCLEVAGRIHETVDIPLVFMTYYNPVLHFGLEQFCTACKKTGVDGLIVPDLPPDEAAGLDSAAVKSGLDLIFLLTPTSTLERTKLVTGKSRGFVYLVSLVGITGTRDSLPAGLDKFIKKVRKETDKPLCAGFGISSPEQARQVAQIADGVIIGSRLIQIITEDGPSYEKTGAFISEVRTELDK